MGIDLSHTNQKTFYDMIDLIKTAQKAGKSVHCYTSHSNSYALAAHKRNLTDEQLQALKEVQGFVGIVIYPPFLGNKSYIEHLKHIIRIIGIDHVMIASDNMHFVSIYDQEQALEKQSVYSYDCIKENIEKDLLKLFSTKDTKKIIEANAKKLYNEIKGDKKKC